LEDVNVASGLAVHLVCGSCFGQSHDSGGANEQRSGEFKTPMRDESSVALVIQGFREELAHDIEESPARFLGTHRLLERIDARAQGTQVLVEYELDEAASHLWWGRISGAVRTIFIVFALGRVQKQLDFFSEQDLDA
jgi:hypothetical protein